jgi:hypothetical protein
MRTAPPFSDRQLEAFERRDYGRDSGLIHKLCRELRAAKDLIRTLEGAYICARQRALEIERGAWPMGRVLLVDMPPYDDQDNGAVIAYHDPTIDLCWTSAPVNDSDKNFDTLLEKTMTLGRLPKRFCRMPWELSSRHKTSWTRWKRGDAVAALARAEAIQTLIDVKNQSQHPQATTARGNESSAGQGDAAAAGATEPGRGISGDA